MSLSAVGEEQRFRRSVSRSWEAVWAIAKHVHSKGCAIQVQPLRLRPTFDERTNYGDAEDILVMPDGSTSWLRGEVKWRGLAFTSRKDFPYPTVFVDRVEKADKTVPNAYFMVNRDLTSAAVIRQSSRPFWVCKTHHDREKGHSLTVYECPVERAEFFKIGGAGAR